MLERQAQFGVHIRTIDCGWAILGSASNRPQPSASCDSELAIVLDGRIDNRTELSARLGVSATDDSMLLLHGWRQFGSDLIGRLEGSFAFAVIERRKRCLHLVRDLAGSRPLVFASNNGLFAFSSMPSGLCGVVDTSPDLGVLAASLRYDTIPGRATEWRGIERVPLASFLSTDGRSLAVRPHFDHNAAAATRLPAAEQADALAEKIDRAVGFALHGAGDVVASHLSAGLDSTAVTTSAALTMPNSQRLIAYTSAPVAGPSLLTQSHRFNDETALAAQTARQAGIEHRVIRSGASIIDTVRGCAHYFQQPPPNPHNLGWWRAVNHAAREDGATVLLTGQGGNATISFGGIFALAALLRSGRLLSWAKETIGLHAHHGLRWRGLAFASLEPFLPARVAAEVFARANRFHHDAETSFVRLEIPAATNPGSHSPSADMREIRWKLFSDGDQGQRNAGMEALTGIEERDPTCNRALVDFCFSLPIDAALRNGRTRPLLRDVLAERAPRSVVDNPLRGLQGSDVFDRIDQKQARACIEEIASCAAARDLLDLPRLNKAVDQWPDPSSAGYSSSLNFMRRLTDALSAGLYLTEIERYPIGTVPRK